MSFPLVVGRVTQSQRRCSGPHLGDRHLGGPRLGIRTDVQSSGGMSTSHAERPDAASNERTIVRQALPADARRVFHIVEPYARDRVLIAKDLIAYFEAIQEFLVADVRDGDDRWQ